MPNPSCKSGFLAKKDLVFSRLNKAFKDHNIECTFQISEQSELIVEEGIYVYTVDLKYLDTDKLLYFNRESKDCIVASLETINGVKEVSVSTKSSGVEFRKNNYIWLSICPISGGEEILKKMCELLCYLDLMK